MSTPPTQKQRKELRDALISAFPERSSLEQLLYFQLEKNLNQITKDSNLNVIVFELIKTAESEGWLIDLINAARKEKPGNSQLTDIAQKLLTTETSLKRSVSTKAFPGTQEYSVAKKYKKDIIDFKKFLPETYLDNLPRIKYKSYIEAHKLWDTGVTSQMHEGNKLLANKLYKMLIDIAETAYTSDFFEGKTVSQYYNDIISRLMKAPYYAQPNLSGTIYRLIAHSQRSQIIDEYIVKIVKDITEFLYFLQWKAKWDRAKELGTKGICIDILTM